MDSFLNILKDKELWLNHCRFMNDYAEHVEMLVRVRKYLQELPLSGAQAEFRKVLQHLMTLVRQSPYLACFSSECDLLSQWRAYSDDGAGFAIGFSADAIKHECDDCGKAADVGIQVRQVSYDPTQVFAALCERIQDYSANQNRQLEREQTCRIGTPRNLGDGCCVQNAGFREECEWRIVMLPEVAIDDDYGPVEHHGVSERRFRVSVKSIVPYYVLKFPHTAITEIHLGPKNYAQWRRNAGDAARVPACQRV